MTAWNSPCIGEDEEGTTVRKDSNDDRRDLHQEVVMKKKTVLNSSCMVQGRGRGEAGAGAAVREQAAGQGAAVIPEPPP